MIDKILETRKSTLIYDVNVPGVITHTKIFLSPKEHLIGFRSYVPFLIKDELTYYELGYFCEMLYEGVVDAWDILKINGEYIDDSSNDFGLIVEKEDMFLSSKLADNLYREAENLYKQSMDNKKSFGTPKEGESMVLDYDRNLAGMSYVRIQQLKYLLNSKKYQTSVQNIEQAEALFFGRLTTNTYKRLMEDNFNELEEISFSEEIGDTRNIAGIDKMIIQIRGL